MSVTVFFMRLAEVLFFAGMAGSAVVVLISFIDYSKELLKKDQAV